MAISFFDDDDEPATATTRAVPRAGSAPAPPRPRRPQGPRGPDRHTLMIRRWTFLGVALVAVIVIVLVINGCLKSEKTQSLKEYNRQVSTLGQEFDASVGRPLFGALTNAGAKSSLDVQQQVNQLRMQAQSLASQAQHLNVPSEMTGAQRATLMSFNLRVEALEKLVSLLPRTLGGQAKQTSPNVAGAMQILLTSDTIYSQRVAPLIQEALAANGVQGLSTAPSRMLPNIGWLEPNTVVARITGSQSASSSQTGVAPGTHGSALVGVSVGTNQLAPEPTINHISGGGSPTFTATVENDGSNPETNVKVDVTVTAAGKQYRASHVIDSTQPESKVNVEIPVTGIPLGVAAKIEVAIEPVPGEENTENNKGSYLAILSA